MTPESLRFFSICKRNRVELSEDQIVLLERYVTLLKEWNKKLNLISRRDEENVWIAHILHSVSPTFKVDFQHGLKILDLGTGGGLPGIPLKILRPDFAITLLDATQKKIRAVQEIIGELGLTNIATVWGRAEDIGRQKERAKQYNMVLARAVAPLKKLVQWATPFLADKASEQATQEEKGLTRIYPPALIAFKGGDVSSEIQELQSYIKPRSVDVIDLIFHGSEEPGMTDKKLVVISI